MRYVYKDEQSCWHYHVSTNDRSIASVGTGMRWAVLDGRASLPSQVVVRRAREAMYFIAVGALCAGRPD